MSQNFVKGPFERFIKLFSHFKNLSKKLNDQWHFHFYITKSEMKIHTNNMYRKNITFPSREVKFPV